MADPFEEPAKTEMRASCEIAIDQAGHERVEKPLTVDLPTGSSLRGRLKGDLQSLDGEGSRYCYYLRPRAGDALPEWLANLAMAAHELADIKVYVVVNEATPLFERSCKAAGAGLLLINDDNEFERVLDFDTTLPEMLEADLKSKIDGARRALEAKLDLNRNDLRGRFERVGELTRGMDPAVADKYQENVERQYKIWTEWGDRTSARLDAALAARDLHDLEVIAQVIDEGPVLDEDV
ncbi:MAG: hypothetical protein M5U27_14015 [Gaiella sp.]|nr:hypothetical protein [Gaiella sp.]